MYPKTEGVLEITGQAVTSRYDLSVSIIVSYICFARISGRNFHQNSIPYMS